MITYNFQSILLGLNTYLDDNLKEINTDLLKMYNYVIVHYSRNVYNYNANWKKINRLFKFDYEFCNSTKSAENMMLIEKEYRKFARIFKNLQPCEIEISPKLNEYKLFLSKYMEIMVNQIIIPIEIIMTTYDNTIKKYRKIYSQQKKSSKINYDVLEKINNII
jgi:hypothetical protein